jgi:N-methylhydantoinase A
MIDMSDDRHVADVLARLEHDGPGYWTRRTGPREWEATHRPIAHLSIAAQDTATNVSQMLLGVDVGGTFTDAVLVGPDGELHSAKTPTTPGDESEGVAEAITAVLASAGVAPGAVAAFAHGTTVTTNALLEGRAARTALVATSGFTDLIELARQARADLYRLCATHPPPLVPAELRFAADERMGPHGPIQAPRCLAALAEQLANADVEAIAIVLLHGSAHPAHELAVGRVLRRRLPGAHVSLSHEVSATPREYERGATTEIDAALSPLLAGYLRALASRTCELGLPEAAVMQSSGGLASSQAAGAHAALTVLSGPAGGAQGARLLAASAGVRNLLCFDMGGTSCDVCVIDDLVVRESTGRTIGGRPIALPSLDINTVGAGGGSLAWADAGGALRVGPRSAGALPGPAAYGRGGESPTVTDAHVVLGHIPVGGVLAGGVELDARLARRAVARLASALGLDTQRAAEGILRVANSEMAGALRALTVARGIDPRGYALMPFGGAGPLHATAIADELGIKRILCPSSAGVLSALGLAAAAPRRDATASFEAADVGRLLDRARRELGAEPARERVRYALRYVGQSFELSVDAAADASVEELRELFGDAHEREYGYREDRGAVELVTVTASVWGSAPEIVPRSPRGVARRAVQRIWHEGRELEAALLIGLPTPGERLAGPAICALAGSTLLITPGWSGSVGSNGTIELERSQ